MRVGERALAAVSPRPPNLSDTIVARTESCFYAAKVRVLCVVQGALSVVRFTSLYGLYS